MPSIAILSSVYSMPAAWHSAASSSLILREASEMSVSPAQNFLKPSPVPGPSIVYLKSGLLAASASATPVEIGSTVDEPETLIEPVTAPPVAALALSAGALAGALSAAALVGGGRRGRGAATRRCRPRRTGSRRTPTLRCAWSMR